MNDETRQFIDELRERHKNINIVSAGSSLKFCLIAEGLGDVYPCFAPTMEWDTAVGQTMIEGIGGEVISYSRRITLRNNSVNLINPWFVVRSSYHKG